MDDLEFVQRCVEGDKLAWDEFVDKYSNLIYRYIHSALQSKGADLSSPDTMHDLFQDFFLLLTKDNFKKLKKFKGKNGCSLASWLRQVTVNYMIDYLRLLKPVVSLEERSESGKSLKESIVDNSLSPSEELIEKDSLEQLMDCIRILDTEDKYFLELYIERGLSLKELEYLLRISRGAVDMRKARIIGRLRDCFKSKGFELNLAYA